VPGFDADRAAKELLPYLEGRTKFLLAEGLPLAGNGRPFPADEVAAVLGASWDRLPDALARLRALHSVRRGHEGDFEALSVAFKRVRNILKGQTSETLDPAGLVEPAEQALAETVRFVGHRVGGATDMLAQFEALASLRPHVDEFFETVLVMAEDPALRRNRAPARDRAPLPQAG
jgi:glycyl-tRNA synthetase beta chain